MSTTDHPIEANQPDPHAPTEPAIPSTLGVNSTSNPPPAATSPTTINQRTPAQAAAWAKAGAATPNVAQRPATTSNPARASQIVVGTLMAVAALLTFFSMAPDEPYEDTRSSIEATDDANNARTEGAPQQAVVNGWTTIEYLNLMSTQQENADNRGDALMLIALIGGGAAIATSRISRD